MSSVGSHRGNTRNPIPSVWSCLPRHSTRVQALWTAFDLWLGIPRIPLVQQFGMCWSQPRASVPAESEPDKRTFRRIRVWVARPEPAYSEIGEIPTIVFSFVAKRIMAAEGCDGISLNGLDLVRHRRVPCAPGDLAYGSEGYRNGVRWPNPMNVKGFHQLFIYGKLDTI